jgi:hypothetical protein
MPCNSSDYCGTMAHLLDLCLVLVVALLRESLCHSGEYVRALCRTRAPSSPGLLWRISRNAYVKAVNLKVRHCEWVFLVVQV